MTIAYIGLGSNLGDPINHIRSAIATIATLPLSQLLQQSSLYRTAPIGPVEQADFVNAVIAIETDCPPQELLVHLQAIEHAHQRQRYQAWGPRTLDLDILLYGDQHIDSIDLKIPHPEMHKRAFVLIPLAEISPDLIFPNGKNINELAQNVHSQAIKKHSSQAYQA